MMITFVRMEFLQQTIRPTAIIDMDIAKSNLNRMHQKALDNQLSFRPHFKTHQSTVVGKLFQDAGIKKITVSSVMMAEYFASAGWDDITIAFPVNIREIDRINALAGCVELGLLVESEEVVCFLAQHIRHSIKLFIKGDAGYGRTGIEVENLAMMERLIQHTNSHKFLSFAGWLVHNGHTYHAKTKSEILSIHQCSQKKLMALYRWKQKHYPETIISLGDTPALSVSDSFQSIDELRPGNFIYHDVMQLVLGSCNAEQMAMSVACPVVAKHADRNEVVIYGGGVHLSKESITVGQQKIYGYIGRYTTSGWDLHSTTNYVRSLSQEHGIVKVEPELMDQINIGDLLAVFPVHSCMIPSLLGESYSTRGETISVMRNF